MIASLVSNVLSAKKANISFESTPERKHLVIEGIGENEIVPIEGEEGKPVVVSCTPLAVAPGNPITLHQSTTAQYRDNGIDWYESGKAALASPFQYGPG